MELVSDSVLISDGGLATELEARGHDLSDPLWSARLLVDAPHAITAVHTAYFRAGAQIATTASYQASFEGFAARGIGHDDATVLLRRSVELAQAARDEVGVGGLSVAASVGPYGAALADGSEYRGCYGLSVAALMKWHLPRLEVLVDAGADMLALETIPDIDEAEALVNLVRRLATPAWLSYTINGTRTRAGQPLTDAFAVAAGVPGLYCLIEALPRVSSCDREARLRMSKNRIMGNQPEKSDVTAAPDTVEGDSHTAMTPRQRLTVLATGLGIFMVFVDVNIVNVALPSIQKVFHTGEQGLQWAVAGYSLGMAAVLMSCALLGDRYGRRRSFVFGVTLFVVSSIVCVLPVSLAVFTVARVIQGLGAAFISVLSLALLSHSFPNPRMKARAISNWMAIGMVGAASAPALGGLMVDGLGWRSVFLVNVPLGAIVWLLTLVGVDESQDPEPTQLDWVGQLTLIPAVALIAYTIIEAPRFDRQSAGFVAALLLAAGVLLWLFVRHEHRAAFPLVDLKLFAEPLYRSVLIVYFVVMSCFFGTLMVITQHFQNVRDLSPLHAGLMMLPVPAGFGVASLLAGRAVNKWGPQLPVLTCLAAMFIGLAIFAISMDHAHPVALVGLTIFGAGAGGCATPLLHLGMTKVDDGRAGMAAGMLNLQRSLGGIFGVAFLGTIVAAWLGAALPNTMADEIPDPIARAIVVDVIVDSANPHAHAAFIGPGHRITAAQEDEIVLAADAVFVSGIKLALGGAAVLLTGAFVLGWTRFPRTPAS